MKLYILIPHNYDVSYNNYMNNWFKMNDWKGALQKNLLDIEVQYICPDIKINPDYNEDFLLVTDIQSRIMKQYYDDYIILFDKNKRFVVIYECLMHNAHTWKYKYVVENFNVIFQNSTKLTKKKNIFWIPCWNYYMKHDNYSNNKSDYCCVSPIFDIGRERNDSKVLGRVKLIKEFCEKENRIHVYGTDKWKYEIPGENFKGKIPNEESVGIRGNFNLEEKIKNKCGLLSQYKFNLVFENIFVDGFVSEKLVEALYSNSVIIYYGPKNIKDIYSDLFDEGVVNGHDHNVCDILEFMNNMNDDEYEKRVNKIKSLRDELNWNNSSENIKIRVIDKIKNYIKNYI